MSVQDGVVSVRGPGFAHSPARMLIDTGVEMAYVFTHRGAPVQSFSVADMSGTIRRGSVTNEDDEVYRWYSVHVGCSYKLAKCRASTSELVALIPDEEEAAVQEDDDEDNLLGGMTVAEVVQAVRDGDLEAETALVLEEQSANPRTTLIAQLEALAEREDEWSNELVGEDDTVPLTVFDG